MPLLLLIVVTVLIGGLVTAVYWRTRTSSRFDGLLFLVGASVAAVFALNDSGTEIARGWESVTGSVGGPRGEAGRVGSAPPAHAASDLTWPPALNEPYPDLQLVDQEGRRTSLSEFRGRVVLIEPIGLPCRACIALAGGHEHGPFDGVPPQGDLQSLEHYAHRFGNVDLRDERLVVVQILFYDKHLAAPTAADARRWAEHFQMDRSANRIVLAAEPYLLGPATHAMISGLQLLDRDLVLRYDSTGHHPRHDLYRELLPAIGALLEE